MTRSIVFVSIALSSLLVSACGPVRQSHHLDAAIEAAYVTELRKAGSQAELADYIHRNEALGTALQQERNRIFCADQAQKDNWRCKRLKSSGEESELESVMVTGSRIKASDIITNNQEAGIDEGDIVKKFGNLLLVLRRGVLHSIDIAPDGRPGLAHVSRLDAGPISDDEDDPVWYDEILVADHTLILLGFNWMAGRSELLIFDIDAHGTLARRAHYAIPVEDYFTGSNYGARIESDNLLLSLSTTFDDDSEDWPSWQRLDRPDTPQVPLIEPEDIYLPLAVEPNPSLHLVVRCPLASLGRDDFHCNSTGIIGSGRSEFYASARAAYLSLYTWDTKALLHPRFDPWLSPFELEHDESLSHLRDLHHTTIYRIRFDKAQHPQMAQARGTTGNQFSFLERGNDLFLATESGTYSNRIVNLQHIALNRFSPRPGTWANEVAHIPASRAHQTFRFSDNALWIGASWWMLDDDEKLAPLLRQPLDGGPWTSPPITHSADMLQPAGKYMLALGEDTADAWRASLITDQPTPRIADSVEMHGYEAAESRSHAINLAALPSGDWLAGFPGLPLDGSYDSERDIDPSADLLLYHIHNDRLIDAGALAMDDPTVTTCAQHCTDWYGNARIFFIGPRIFALSGGVLAEAALVNGKVVEQRRVVLE